MTRGLRRAWNTASTDRDFRSGAYTIKKVPHGMKPWGATSDRRERGRVPGKKAKQQLRLEFRRERDLRRRDLACRLIPASITSSYSIAQLH